MKKSIIFLVVITLGLIVKATPVRLSQPSYGGSGCPDGSASIVLTDDQIGFSLLLDSMVSEAGGDTKLKFDRKICNVLFVLDVSPGYQAKVTPLNPIVQLLMQKDNLVKLFI